MDDVGTGEVPSVVVGGREDCGRGLASCGALTRDDLPPPVSPCVVVVVVVCVCVCVCVCV